MCLLSALALAVAAGLGWLRAAPGMVPAACLGLLIMGASLGALGCLRGKVRIR